MSRRLLLVAAAVAQCVGCGKKSSSSTATAPIDPGTPPLLAADLTATSGFTANTPAQADMLTTFNKLSYFYNNQPAAASPSNCDAVLNALTMTSNTVSAKVDTTVDISACLAKDDAGSTFTTATLHLYFYLTCSAGDLSSLNGVKFSANGNSLLQNCTNGTAVSESVSTVIGTFTSNGTSIGVNSREVTYQGASGLVACGFTNAGKTFSYANTCITIDKSDSSSTVSGTTTKAEDLTSLTYTGVTDDNSATTNVWHKGGSMGVTYDNWTGTVTFTGSAAAPTYSLSQAGAAAVTGALVSTPGN